MLIYNLLSRQPCHKVHLVAAPELLDSIKQSFMSCHGNVDIQMLIFQCPLINLLVQDGLKTAAN